MDVQGLFWMLPVYPYGYGLYGWVEGTGLTVGGFKMGNWAVKVGGLIRLAVVLPARAAIGLWVASTVVTWDRTGY